MFARREPSFGRVRDIDISMISSAYKRLFLTSFVIASVIAAPGVAGAEDRLLTEAVDFTGGIAFLSSGAPALVIAAVRDGETAFAGFG
jgi:D-alanyl-D-alanine-carboxypeptidase/D-alanyl-D-alanine-endopeptidase